MSEELQNPSYLECVDRLQDEIAKSLQGVKDAITSFNTACVEFSNDCSQLLALHGADIHERTITKRSLDVLERTINRLVPKTSAIVHELNGAMNETNKMAARSKKFDDQKGLN